MPLYPYLQAAFYRSDMSDKQLFKQAKQLNIILSMVFLGLLFLIFLKSFRFYQAFLLIIIIAYSLYIFKAPYMQAEILFFSIAAISFILMLNMLIRPTWWLAIVTGIMVGLAYLTKGTVLPSLFLFAALYGAKQVISMVREVRNAGLSNLRTVAIQFGYLIILLVFFTVTVYPYLRAMKLMFGHYFYNVNTTVYIWYDSYDQAIEGEAKYHFTQGWPEQLPEDQIPGIGKYLSDHTLQQIIGRFMTGFGMQLNNIYSQYSVTNYPISYLIIFLLAILIDVRNGFRTARNNPYLVLFTILYFFGYLVAFSWYAPIAGGRRFFFGLYIPLLIVVFASINELAKNQPAAYGEKAPKINLARFFSTSNVIIALTLIYNIWLILTRVLFYSRFGS